MIALAEWFWLLGFIAAGALLIVAWVEMDPDA